MPSPKTLEELHDKLKFYLSDHGDTDQKIKSIMFNVVDFLLNENSAPQEAIDAGMYYMPHNVGDTKFVKAYQEMLWACYEHYCEKGGVSGPAGPWVHIDSNGIHLSRERHPYDSVTIVKGLNNND